MCFSAVASADASCSANLAHGYSSTRATARHARRRKTQTALLPLCACIPFSACCLSLCTLSSSLSLSAEAACSEGFASVTVTRCFIICLISAWDSTTRRSWLSCSGARRRLDVLIVICLTGTRSRWVRGPDLRGGWGLASGGMHLSAASSAPFTQFWPARVRTQRMTKVITSSSS